jgi:hypothetical protein
VSKGVLRSDEGANGHADHRLFFHRHIEQINGGRTFRSLLPAELARRGPDCPPSAIGAVVAGGSTEG